METRDGTENNEDFRVRLTSKKHVIEQMEQYKALIKQALDGQTGIEEKTKRHLLEQALADFEAAVTSNVSVSGRTWDDAPEDDGEEEDQFLDLEKEMDDAIVELARKRRAGPPRILSSAVRALRAWRELQVQATCPYWKRLFRNRSRAKSAARRFADRERHEGFDRARVRDGGRKSANHRVAGNAAESSPRLTTGRRL
ncbi:kinetochore-associated protein NSL1 homolog isoform X2 [Stigmatopora nigra]